MAERPTAVRYQILAWLTLAAALSYLCRSAVGVAESSIREHLHLTLDQSGWFMGAFFWTYAVFQLPSGWMSQHYGTRFALSLFALAWSVATLGIGLAPGFWMLLIAQLLMGTAQAGIFPASCNSIGYWMPMSQRSLGCGILAAGMQTGAIVASGVTGILMAPFGWRGVFILFALPCFLWTLCFLLRFRDRPEQVPAVNSEELKLIRSGREQLTVQHDDSHAAPVDWWAVARNPDIWFLCGQQICRASGYMFFASWFPTFLQSTRGVSVEASGLLQGMVLAGTLTGSLLGGMVVDWIWRRTGNLNLSRSGVGTFALGACGLLVLGAWFVENATLAICLLTLGSLFAALAGPCTFAATIDIGGPQVPQIFGLVNMTGNFSAAACPVLVAKLFQWTANWNLVLALFACVYLTGALCWALFNPQRSMAFNHRLQRQVG